MVDQPLTEAELDALDALYAAGTNGPLSVTYRGRYCDHVEAPGRGAPTALIHVHGPGWWQEPNHADAELFAAAHNALPRLTAEVRRLSASLDTLRGLYADAQATIDQLRGELDRQE